MFDEKRRRIIDTAGNTHDSTQPHARRNKWIYRLAFCTVFALSLMVIELIDNLVLTPAVRPFALPGVCTYWKSVPSGVPCPAGKCPSNGYIAPCPTGTVSTGDAGTGRSGLWCDATSSDINAIPVSADDFCQNVCPY